MVHQMNTSYRRKPFTLCSLRHRVGVSSTLRLRLCSKHDVKIAFVLDALELLQALCKDVLAFDFGELEKSIDGAGSGVVIVSWPAVMMGLIRTVVCLPHLCTCPPAGMDSHGRLHSRIRCLMMLDGSWTSDRKVTSLKPFVQAWAYEQHSLWLATLPSGLVLAPLALLLTSAGKLEQFVREIAVAV